MLLLASLATLVYAVVNAFGAWAVVRRKPAMAALFMLAASVLTVAGVALVTDLPFTRVLLAAGLVLASLASLINARVVFRRVNPRNHLVRAAFAASVFLVAHLALP